VAYKKSGGQIFSYFNLKNARTQGVEIEAGKKILNTISLKAGFQYLNTADKEVLKAIKAGTVFERSLETGSSSRMKTSGYGGLPNRSKFSANAKATYDNNKGFFTTFRIFYRGRWGTNDLDGNGLINRADEYAKGNIQVNASLGYKLGERWDVMAGVDNIFDYKDIQNLPGNPGRVGYATLQIHL
jgi:outer membrane receptor for ferrienterochelin and colicins